MGKIIEFIAESAIKIKPEKVLTDITKITDPTQIATLVSSGKKDDRVSIAANPNLSIAQQLKLSTDKVELVKNALCFNATLDADIARTLLKDDIDRLEIISKYGKKQLSSVVLEFIKDDRLDNDYRIIQNLLNGPDISEEVVEYVIKNHANQLTNPGTRNLYVNKTMTKKVALLLLDHLKDVEYKGDATLSRLIINNPQFIKESDIAKLDWKNNSELQAAISARPDFSAKLVSDMVDNLTEDTHLELINPHMKDVDIVNKVMEKYLTFKLSYKQNFEIFKDSTHLPLNPKLMVKMIHHLHNNNYDNHASYFLNNKFFPSYGLDEIEVTEDNIRDILSSPATDVKRAEEILKKMLTTAKNAERALTGLSARKDKLKIDKSYSKKILDLLSSKSLWFEYYVFGDEADDVINNVDKYAKFYTDYGYKTTTPKFSVLSSLVKNRNLTVSQRKNLFDAYNKLTPNEILPHTNFISALSLYDENQDPDLFRSVMTQGGKIWEVWNVTNILVYYKCKPEITKIIDELALENNEIPSNILKLDGKNNFSGWVDFNNKQGVKMSDETAIKYLLHFIKNGNERVRKIILDNYINEKWMVPEITTELYDVTGDVAYLPKEARDIFLF